MKKELQEIREIDEKMLEKSKLIDLNTKEDINVVRNLKNDIYERTCMVFIYNLKKLIQVEGTQKNLAKKIGISEDLLSKYKTREAFPTIETLIYICRVYKLDLNNFITTPLGIMDIERIENSATITLDIFEKSYYVYFFVTNSMKEGTIHEGIVEISDRNVSFKILTGECVVKQFDGTYNNSDKLIFFNLVSKTDGNAIINMIKPNINKSKYVGGVSMLLLSSDANSKPCSQKIIFSKIRIDRDLNYEKLKEILNFNIEGIGFGNIKLSPAEDEKAYNFIETLC